MAQCRNLHALLIKLGLENLLPLPAAAALTGHTPGDPRPQLPAAGVKNL
jgi:hypothetical protein